MASEWINGFTLVDLLRHRGRLELPEALRLLADASDAAAHGSTNGLHRLQLTPHQTLVHFATAFEGDRDRAVRAMVDRPLAKWPAFGLKIEAVSPAREMGRTPTWAGSMTLVPGARGPGRDTQSSIRGLVEGSYFYALGALLYEILNGTPPPASSEGGREVPPLPMLGEEANDLLQRALSANPGFRDEREFFDAVLAACGLGRGDLRFGREEGPKMPRVEPAGDATVVPNSMPVVGAASTVSMPMPAPVRMAPPIRTKLLRPKGASFPTEAPPAPGPSPWQRLPPVVIAAGVAAAVVLVAVGVFLLVPKGHPPAPPQNTSVETPAPQTDATDAGSSAATPAPRADEPSPTP